MTIIIIVLSVFLILIGLLLGVWERHRERKARRELLRSRWRKMKYPKNRY